MLSRFILSAGVAALLCAAPALAQEAEKPIVKPAAQSGEAAGKAGNAPDMPAAKQGAGDAMESQAGDKMKKPQGAAQQAEQGQGDEGQVKRKKQQDAASGNAQGQDAQPAQGDNQRAGQDRQGGDGLPAMRKREAQGTQDDDTAKNRAAKAQTEPEKRTIIREKIVTRNVQRVNREDLDIDINVGVAVPRSIHLYPLPATVVEVVPEYDDYLYFVLADGSIVIVEPDSMQIVTIISA